MAENFSTKTIISFTNIFVNMENFFNYIPIRDIAIERKNNRKKKIENVFSIDDKQEEIPSGSIVCVKWRNKERGTIIKTASIVRSSNVKKKKRDKYFLNSITTIMYFNNDKYKDKLINLKITNTGRIQMTGCKDDDLTVSCIRTLINTMNTVKDWTGVDLYEINTSLSSMVVNTNDIVIILYTVMKNKNINIGFKINREKLDQLINEKYQDYISIFDGTTSGAGVNIKTKINKWEENLPMFTIDTNENMKTSFVNTEKVIKVFTKSNKHNMNKYHTFLCFKSGSCIHSGRGDDMNEALDKFVKILYENRSEVEDV
jgi:hypothetical protein